mmetsp:Transcript_15687/g.52502  ORF Transcript_15687/g.52502 Transcript_15687/m.52502 type:complete len:272 (+) Transcript_15687:353-1168(+)
MASKKGRSPGPSVVAADKRRLVIEGSRLHLPGLGSFRSLLSPLWRHVDCFSALPDLGDVSLLESLHQLRSCRGHEDVEGPFRHPAELVDLKRGNERLVRELGVRHDGVGFEGEDLVLVVEGVLLLVPWHHGGRHASLSRKVPTPDVLDEEGAGNADHVHEGTEVKLGPDDHVVVVDYVSSHRQLVTAVVGVPFSPAISEEEEHVEALLVGQVEGHHPPQEDLVLMPLELLVHGLLVNSHPLVLVDGHPAVLICTSVSQQSTHLDETVDFKD